MKIDQFEVAKTIREQIAKKEIIVKPCRDFLAEIIGEEDKVHLQIMIDRQGTENDKRFTLAEAPPELVRDICQAIVDRYAVQINELEEEFACI